MYDIEFVIPICMKNQYKQRLLDFKKYGLLNVGDNKALVSVLTDKKDAKDPALIGGWPDNVDINIVTCPTMHEACKTYHYFFDYPKSHLDNVRWVAKIDDDSVNDVARLVQKLDEEYDHKREYYIVTNLQDDIDDVERDLLIDMGYGKWFDYKDREPFVFHEKEGSIISQAGMKRILATPDAVELMRRRSFIAHGYTDVCLACAARIAKIYAVDARFLSPDPLIAEFTLFGGNVCHIHFVSQDVNPDVWRTLVRKVDEQLVPDEDQEFLIDLSGTRYLLSSVREPCICVVRLGETGKVETTDEDNWREWIIWTVKENTLTFLGFNGEVTGSFELNSDFSKIHGRCKSDEIALTLHRLP